VDPFVARACGRCALEHTRWHEHRPASQSASLPPRAHAGACWPWSSAQAIREGARAQGCRARGAAAGHGAAGHALGQVPGRQADGVLQPGDLGEDELPRPRSHAERQDGRVITPAMRPGACTSAHRPSCTLAASIIPVHTLGPYVECIALAAQQSGVHRRNASCQYCMRSAAGHAP